MQENRSRSIVGEETYEENREDYQKGLFLTFRIANEDYGLEIRDVTEIIGIQQITQVPEMPPFVKGVINLRGNVVPVMDVRSRFGSPEREHDDRTCIIVVKVGEKSVGLLVDKVNEVVTIPENQIEPPPVNRRNETGSYIQGMGKTGEEVKILLDVQRLIFQNGYEEMALV